MSFFRLLLDAMLLLGSPIIPLLVHQHQQLHPLDNQQALDTLCLCTPPEQNACTDMPPCCDLTLELKHTIIILTIRSNTKVTNNYNKSLQCSGEGSPCGKLRCSQSNKQNLISGSSKLSLVNTTPGWS